MKSRVSFSSEAAVAPSNTRAGGQDAPYVCGRSGDLFAPKGAFPIDRSGKKWKVTFGGSGDTPLRTMTVTQAVFVGYGQ